MGHLAVHGHFHLQAAVVCGDDLIGKACRNQQIRLGQLVFEQPAWAKLATKFLIVGEQQFHRPFERQLQ